MCRGTSRSAISGGALDDLVAALLGRAAVIDEMHRLALVEVVRDPVEIIEALVERQVLVPESDVPFPDGGRRATGYTIPISFAISLTL